MKCYHCEHYDNKTDICDVDGKVVINPWSDAECDYLKEPETVFDRITQSPEVLAEKLVYVIKQLFTISGTSRENPGGYEVKTKWFSTIVDGDFDSEAEAIAATVAKLKEEEE